LTTVLAQPFGSFLPHFASDVSTAERWLAETSVDFTYTDAVDLAASLAGVFRGSRGVYRVRLGGTAGEPDGLEILTLALLPSAVWVEELVRAPRLTVRGVALFKFTVVSMDANAFTEVNGATLTLWVTARTPPIVGPLVSDIGIDIWMGDNDGTGTPDFNVTSAGDWRLVNGREAVKQSLRRRFMTSPGEWATKPDYGAGLLAAVKSRARETDLDDIKNRLQAQALKDERVLRVLSVTVAKLGTYGIKYSVKVQLKGDEKEPVEIADNLQEDRA
jgi:phage baseplate assembly protein W